MTFSKVLPLALLALCSFAQPPSNPYPNDPSGQLFYPNDQFSGVYCAYVTLNNGVTYPSPGVVVNFDSYVTRFSGWHSHDSGSLRRPQMIPLSPLTGTTGYNGCTPPVTWQFPGFAGWYTFEAVPTNTAFHTKGINNYAKYYTESNGAFSNLVPYPDNQQINVPQSYHIDYDHGSGGFSRYVTLPVATRLTSASVAYNLNAADLKVQPIGGNRLDITRCSIPDGGIADNDKGGLSPSDNGNPYLPAEWQTRISEEHGVGTECDVVNPSTIDNDHYVLAMQVLQLNACIVGVYDPDGNRLTTPLTYWINQSVVHVTCSRAPLGIVHIGGGK